MRLAICYSSKNQLELTEQTYVRMTDSIPYRTVEVLWADASSDETAIQYAKDRAADRVFGGADAAIAWKLTKALADPSYTHIMLLENDVLLDPDWFDPTTALFDKGKTDGLHVGAVSPRSYVDRILIQRDGYAVMHNIGAGAIIFTREAAEIALRTFRTGFWPVNRYLFSQISGIDIGTYACFGVNAQPITTDWQFEVQLARHGLACLALTPAKVQMIGQNPPLEQQGLELTTGPVDRFRNEQAFEYFVRTMDGVRNGKIDLSEIVSTFDKRQGQTLFFPHQIGYLFAQQQGWKLRWQQGFGPFGYVAGPGGASLSVRVSGSCSFLVSGGEDRPANCQIVDAHSGYHAEPILPAFTGEFIEATVPGTSSPRTVAVSLSEGGIFYGITCGDPQMLDASYSFSWDKLPESI